MAEPTKEEQESDVNPKLKENPTRADIIKWYKDQIELAALRNELTVLQSETVQAEVLRLQALGVLAQMKQGPSQNKNDSKSDKLDDEGQDKE